MEKLVAQRVKEMTISRIALQSLDTPLGGEKDNFFTACILSMDTAKESPEHCEGLRVEVHQIFEVLKDERLALIALKKCLALIALKKGFDERR